MNFLVTLSIKNLFRHKARNFLLLIAVMIGICLIQMLFAWSNGIFDIIFNKLVARITGNIQIIFTENGKERKEIIRNKNKIEEIIIKNVPELKDIQENITLYCKVLGNNEGSYGIITGVDPEKDFLEMITLIEGNKSDFTNINYQNPVIMSIKKAQKLNLKLYDNFKINFRTIYGQEQTLKLILVGLTKGDNFFFNSEMYIPISNLKYSLGYNENETRNLKLILKYPQLTKIVANRLHKLLNPDVSIIETIYNNQNILILSLYTNEKINYLKNDKIELFDQKLFIENNGLIISYDFAITNKLKVGDKINLSFVSKNNIFKKQFIISGIINKKLINKNLFFINEKVYYELWEEGIQVIDNKKIHNSLIKELIDIFGDCFVKEWNLLPLNSPVANFEKRYRMILDEEKKGVNVQITTMYESAGNNLDFGYILYYSTWLCSLFLFLFIIIGLVNTLRMSIRERTKEIGTMRALGMQISDIRKVFLLEYLTLTTISSILGIIMSFIMMNLLKMIKINIEGLIVEIILVNGHIHFIPDYRMIIIVEIVFLILVYFSIYFPANRAASMKPSEALRHYE